LYQLPNDIVCAADRPPEKIAEAVHELILHRIGHALCEFSAQPWDAVAVLADADGAGAAPDTGVRAQSPSASSISPTSRSSWTTATSA
jgi:hypothetical protein